MKRLPGRLDMAVLLGTPAVLLSLLVPDAGGEILKLRTRSRLPPVSHTSIPVAGSDRLFTLQYKTVEWDGAKTAIVICDMWDDHTCKGAARRVAEMAPTVDRTVKAARKKGTLVIHAPSGMMSYYDDTPQRRRAIEAPQSKATVPIQWNEWNTQREGQPLDWIVDGGCGCAKPCAGFVEQEDGIRKWQPGGKIPWSRQIDTIEIAAADAISDDGQEIYNLLEKHDIDNVILLGVHTNICVSGRPFGLRQMVYFGKNVVLCRDLTDALFQTKSPEIDQFRGTELFVEHIEKHICPTITSSFLTGEPPFHFTRDAVGE